MPTLEADRIPSAIRTPGLETNLQAISAHRIESGPLPGGNSPCISSNAFRVGLHEDKPWARPIVPRLSDEGKAREASTLKAASVAKGEKKSRPISLGTARPNGRYLPWDSLTMTTQAMNPANGRSRNAMEVDTPDSKAELKGFQRTIANCRRGELAFDLNIALNYGYAAGSPQVLRFLTEHVELVHDPPYRDWATTLTCSTTSALDILFRMLCNRGDSVLCEEFSYSGTIEAATPLGISLVGLNIDDEGLIPEVLEAKLRDWVTARDGMKPRALYTIPTGQNPTATTQSLERRKAIYAVAERHDLLIIEDDPYHFLQLSLPETITTEQYLSSLPTSYLSLDTSGRVLRLETTSKILAPGLRLGWLTGPSEFVAKFISHMDFSAAFPSGPSQIMVYKLLDETWGHSGFLEWLINLSHRMGESRDILLRACEKYLPSDVCHWKKPEAGMFVWIKIDMPTGERSVLEVEDQIYRQALGRGVKPGKGSWFAVDEEAYDAVAFRLTFAAAEPEVLGLAVERFAEAVREVAGKGVGI
ncbi:Aminotransferase class I and II [Teratosphaeria destructans]|uniref:Aminotransferase class I and II n=1 Tax=Teratosphaeria destructans TaxID=418781 RepID=A0A9W7SJ94_9PEZI|nr:Aminotransferase class I and II [Teratosphaeria destructans]